MVKFVGGLDEFLLTHYPEKFVTISFGHIEDYTKEMEAEYSEWYKNDYSKRPKETENNVKEENQKTE